MDTPRLTHQEIAALQQHVGYGSAWLGPVLVSGHGSRVTDIDGKSYIGLVARAAKPRGSGGYFGYAGSGKHAFPGMRSHV